MIAFLGILYTAYRITSAGVVTLDSWSEYTTDSLALYDDVWTYGQTFHPYANAKITGASFHLLKYFYPLDDPQENATGTLYAKLYNIAGVYGEGSTKTGGVLATSDSVDVEDVPDRFSSGEMVNFPFSGSQQYIMSSTTNYAIEISFIPAIPYETGSGTIIYVNYADDTSHPGDAFICFPSCIGYSDSIVRFIVSGELIDGSPVLANPYDTIIFE